MPEVERAVGPLVVQVMAPPYHAHGDELRAELERRTALRDHLIAVAVMSKTVDELQGALKADGTLDALG